MTGRNGSTRAQGPERGIYSAATVEKLCCCGINSALRPLSLRLCDHARLHLQTGTPALHAADISTTRVESKTPNSAVEFDVQ